MKNNDKVIYYSLLSGEVYEIANDECENLDDFQIPLTARPKSNCDSCFGRGYIGYDRLKKYYPMCRCIMKKIDKERIGEVKLKY